MPAKKRTRPFFDNPWKFSFKDAIAATFVAMDVYTSVRASFGVDSALAVLKELIAPTMLVLGGYFGQEVAGKYFMSKYPQGYAQGMSMYGGYGYTPSYGTAIQSTITPVVNADADEETEPQVTKKY
jgi:hypothetical protein